MLRFTQDILLALRAIANEEEAHEMSKKTREQFDFLGLFSGRPWGYYLGDASLQDAYKQATV